MPLARSAALTLAASIDAIEVDRADDGRALGRIGDERGGPRPVLGPAVEVPRRCPAALDAPVEAAGVEHPAQLVVEQEQRGDGRRVVGLVQAAVGRGRCRGRARPGASGPTRRSARCARRRPASTPPPTARRRRRSTSAGRSSRRRPRPGPTAARRRPTWRRRRRAPSPASAGGAASIATPGRRLVVGQGVEVDGGVGDRARGGRRARCRRRPARRGAVRRRRRRRTSTRTRRTRGARCARRPARTWRRPRTPSSRRCRARPPTRRGARTARPSPARIGADEALDRRLAVRGAEHRRGRRRRGRRAARGAPWTARTRTGRRPAAGRAGGATRWGSVRSLCQHVTEPHVARSRTRSAPISRSAPKGLSSGTSI